MSVYFNDNDLQACAWLRELVQAGCIPAGVVDERPIQGVRPDDVRGFAHCHWFTGIGGWPYALALAGWPVGRPVWTASCPCQPFSAAGKRKGEADERHLWPVLLRLVRECRPATCFGEQVASDDGYRWLARVRDDLEKEGYAVGCADLPACCAGAPHIRQRLWWVAVAQGDGRDQQPGEQGVEGAAGAQDGAEPADGGGNGRLEHAPGHGRGEGRAEPDGRGAAGGRGAGGVADTNGRGRDGPAVHLRERGPCEGVPDPEGSGTPCGLGDSSINGQQGLNCPRPAPGAVERASRNGHNFWSEHVIIPCRDGKARRAEPGIFPLAPRLPGRVGLLRGAGNSIVPQVAAKFVRAFLEAEESIR